MNMNLAWTIGAMLLLGFSNAWAQDDGSDDESETTIRLMDAAEAELPNAVTDDIVLPDSVPEHAAAHEDAAEGLATANENRKRREDGLATADEARANAADMAEDALENIESRGRADDILENIPGRPDVPEPPDMPEIPQPPTG